MEKKRFFLILLLEILVMEVVIFLFFFIFGIKQTNELYTINYKIYFKKEKPIMEESPIFKQENLGWEIATSNAPWTKRDAHTALVFNDKLWILGGVGGRAPDYSQNKSDVWASENGKDWQLMTVKAAWGDRRAHASVVFQNKMWVIGGATLGADGNPDQYLNDVWFSEDGINWIQATSAASWTPRKGHAAVVFDEKIWLFGGAVSEGVTNDVWFTENGKDWTLALGRAPWLPRYDLAVEVFENKIWLAGGVFPERMGQTDLWVSVNGIDWKQIGKKFNWPGRHGHCLIAFESRIWLIGGWSGLGQGFNDVWFSKDGKDWQKTTQDGPWLGREDLTCSVFKNKIWIFGGMTTSGDRTNDVWHSI
jgi:hypothetical protein